ncbi:hypothetical protein WBG78_08485 [Chryseolinea sp. T2]|uniref:hypothetical protein n=1 Tax=Chryseolinea sp. T2 TaxID=3129255 RepID=UPI003077FA4B
MNRLATLKFLFFLAIVSSASAQKVKYKDIYALLSTKQYESAEPFLNRYLKESTDNPNAYLYKGIIFQEKASKDDVLKQTKRMQSNIDSAILFYDIAYKGITEKELKKNGEYYAAYNRRDLRTGEFGVTLSDIQYDLEKRMEGLRERKDRIRMVKHYFELADTLYQRSQLLYTSLQKSYPTQRELYLRADEQLVQKLVALSQRFDSCVKAFDQYKSASGVMGKTGYNQTLEGQPITDFKAEGSTTADFYSSKINVWDYTTFANRVKHDIEADIIPMRKHLISYDGEINKLRDKLSTEQVSVRSDLTTLIDMLLMDQLRKYDKDPLPMGLFSLKIGDLEYKSLWLEQKAKSDTNSIHTRIDMVRKTLASATRLDSMSTLLSARNIDSLSLDYKYFIKETYGSADGVKGFIGSTHKFATAARTSEQMRLNRLTESMRWIVSSSDSIPLFLDSASHSKFRPLVLMDERYTAGLQYADSVNPSGYLYSINPARTAEVKVNFPVEKVSFAEKQLQSSHALSFSDTAGHLYYVLIYSDVPDQDKKFTATLAKIYKSDGLAWSINQKLPSIPKELQFTSLTGELTIVGENGELTTMDKSGKVKSN